MIKIDTGPCENLPHNWQLSTQDWVVLRSYRETFECQLTSSTRNFPGLKTNQKDSLLTKYENKTK